MKIPREVAHWLLFLIGKECRTAIGAKGHPSRCNDFTAAIEARDAEHAAEVARWLELPRWSGLLLSSGNIARDLRDGTWRRDLARFDAAAPAVVPAETPPTGPGFDGPSDQPCASCGQPWGAGVHDYAHPFVAPAPAVTPVPEEVPREVPPPNLNDVVRWLDGEAEKYRAASDRAQDDGLKNESLRCANWMREIECLARAFRDGSWLANVAQLAPATPPTPSAPPAPVDNGRYGPPPRPVQREVTVEELVASAPPREGMGPGERKP